MSGDRIEATGCIAFGCVNEVVRVMQRKDDPSVAFGLCALHVRKGLRYMTDEQVRRLVIPPLAGLGEARPHPPEGTGEPEETKP